MQPAPDARSSLRSWRREEGLSAEGRFCFPGSLPVFGGHFPGAPLLPGVYQLAAVEVLLALVCPGRQLEAVERVKWTRAVAPDQELAVRLSWQQREDGRVIVVAQLPVDAREVASARLRFR